jgi:hypothetical protein
MNWSSYTYRVAAVRNLDRILQFNHSQPIDESDVFKLEAYLINWHLDLPGNKKTSFDQLGNFDEMMFQAQMISNV